MTNSRIKKAMIDADIGITQLAEILGISITEASIMMKRELAVKVQNDIVKRIREWDAIRKGMVS